MGLADWGGEGRVVAVDEGVGGINVDSGLSRKPPPSCVMIGGSSTGENLCDGGAVKDKFKLAFGEC
jgi:hypothetical protein